MHEPLVSVVMPVYNAGIFLSVALTSIIEQTFCGWEMICVNDGSTDGSGKLLDQFARQDARIRVVHQANTGIVGALNHGCELAQGPLICRMDSDDIAIPHRMERQLAFLRNAPTCVAVGGSILEIDTDGDPLCCSRLPNSHAEIESNLLHRRTGLYHPTAMLRTEALRAVGGYRKEYQWVEDHDLWLRLAQRGQLANLDEVILCYRQHSSSVCWQRSAQQRELMNGLLAEAYANRGLDLPPQLLHTGGASRSAAGPGKWARAAAKGGFPRSVAKHLRQLAQAPKTSWSYMLRMTLESTLRLCAGYPRRLFNQEPTRIATFALEFSYKGGTLRTTDRAGLGTAVPNKTRTYYQ